MICAVDGGAAVNARRGAAAARSHPGTGPASRRRGLPIFRPRANATQRKCTGRLSRKVPRRSAMPKSMSLGIVAAAAIVVWTGARANDEKGHGADKDHVRVRPDDVKWGPSPPGLPAGAQAAVLMGDPGKAGPYVIRAKLPDGYKIPPHWHPRAENVTVIRGTFMLGQGDRFSADATEPLPAGSFVSMPPAMRHFAWSKGETVIQVHGMGPFEITYVNPADDPRKR